MKKIAIYGLGGLLALTALAALAHTPTGLATIAWVTGSEGCPFGGDKPPITAQKAEELRVAALVSQGASTTAAPARPARGFTLDRDLRSDIARWASQHHLRCKGDRSGAGLRCLDVAFSDLPSALPTTVRGVVSFGFDAGDRLVSVQLQSATGTPTPALQQLAGAAMAQLEELAPAAITGDALDAHGFAHRRVHVAFADYHGEVMASNLGKRWTVIETYQSAGSTQAGQVATR
jgi:hypothetical protein